MGVIGVTAKGLANGEMARAGIGFRLRDGTAVARVRAVGSCQSRVDGEPDEGHQFANDAERLVWDRLARQVHPDTVLVPNLRLTSTQKDHELDILVLMPEVGVVGPPRAQAGTYPLILGVVNFP